MIFNRRLRADLGSLLEQTLVKIEAVKMDVPELEAIAPPYPPKLAAPEPEAPLPPQQPLLTRFMRSFPNSKSD